MGLEAQQFPMLAGGLTNTMNPLAAQNQMIDEGQLQQALMAYQQQIGQMQPPHQMAVPPAPGALQAFLAQLAGNAGSALAQTPQYSAQAYNSVDQARGMHDSAVTGNQQEMDQYDYRKHALLMDLAAKRVQYAMDKAKRDDNQDAAQQLADIKGQIELIRDEARARASYEKEHVKGEESRLTKQTQGAPNVNISHSTRDYTGLPGGAGGGNTPVYMTAEQIEKRADVVAKNLATDPITKGLNENKYMAALDSVRADLTKRYNPNISLIPPDKEKKGAPKHSVEQLDTFANSFVGGQKYASLPKLAKIAAINKDVDGLTTVTPAAKNYIKRKVMLLLNDK